MILLDHNQDQINGDAIFFAALRSDCAPVPVTLEAVIKITDEAMLELLQEGKSITTGVGDVLQIIYSQPASSSVVQAANVQQAVKIIAFLQSCCAASYVRERPIIKSASTLQSIYRASGCPLGAVGADFSIPRFVCLAGDTPTFHIARAVQEAGGIIRWADGQLQFMRLHEAVRQQPRVSLPNKGAEDVQSEFLERHEAPFFFSVAPDGSVVQGNRSKARSGMFAPHQDVQQLHNMSRVLVRSKVVKTEFDLSICGGDVVEFVGDQNHVVLTALHFWGSGADSGEPVQTYTKLWCGRLA